MIRRFESPPNLESRIETGARRGRARGAMRDQRSFRFSPTEMHTSPSSAVAMRRFAFFAAVVRRLLAALLSAGLIVGCGRDPCQKLVRSRGPVEEDLQSLSGEPGPRCGADDPGCGPEPLHSSGPSCFYSSKPRKRLLAGGASQHAGRDRACAHDGECRIAGCGEVCVHYSLGRIRTTCEAPRWLDEKVWWCGCADSACSFFDQ